MTAAYRNQQDHEPRTADRCYEEQEESSVGWVPALYAEACVWFSALYICPQVLFQLTLEHQAYIGFWALLGMLK